MASTSSTTPPSSSSPPSETIDKKSDTIKKAIDALQKNKTQTNDTSTGSLHRTVLWQYHETIGRPIPGTLVTGDTFIAWKIFGMVRLTPEEEKGAKALSVVVPITTIGTRKTLGDIAIIVWSNMRSVELAIGPPPQ